MHVDHSSNEIVMIQFGSTLASITYDVDGLIVSEIQYRKESTDIHIFTGSRLLRPFAFSSCNFVFSSCNTEPIEWTTLKNTRTRRATILDQTFDCEMNFGSRDVDTATEAIFAELNDECPTLADTLCASYDSAIINDICERLLGAGKVFKLKFAD